MRLSPSGQAESSVPWVSLQLTNTNRYPLSWQHGRQFRFMDANSFIEDKYDLSPTETMASPASTRSIGIPASENTSPNLSSPTDFDLPIRSFLEAYQHPAFVLEAQSLFESLIQRLSIWRTSDPEEPGNVDHNMGHGMQREGWEQNGLDRQGTVRPEAEVGAGGSGKGAEKENGSTVSEGAPGIPQDHLPSGPSPSGVPINSVPSIPQIGPSTHSSGSVDSATVLPPDLPRRQSDPLSLNAQGHTAGNILSEAFAPRRVPEDLAPSGAPPTLHTASDVVMDSLSELPTTGCIAYYPHITGKAADVGWNHTLRSLLAPVWANAAWYDLLHAMNTSTLLGSEDGLLELLSRKDIQALVSFLRSVVATAGGVPPDPDVPVLRSVKLELVSHNTDDLLASEAMPGAGTGEIRVQIELVATMVDSTVVTSAPPGHHPLTGQYLVITSIASNIPTVLDSSSSSSSSRSSSHPDVSGTGGALAAAGENHSPAPPPPTLAVPAGFIVENQRRPKRRRPGALTRHRLSSRGGAISADIPSEEDEDSGETSVRTTESNMMEWADPNASDQLDRPAPAPMAKSQWVPQEMLDADPFCRFLATLSMGRLILAFPWHTTPLGPLQAWSGDLRSLISMMLASPFREALWVGEEAVLLYNDAYVKTASYKHPWLLGKAAAVGWAEIWEGLEPAVRRVREGETIATYDNLLFMNRGHSDPTGMQREETYHIWAFIPSRGTSGDIIAWLNPSFETTSRVIAERRLGILRNLVLTLSLTRTYEEFFTSTLSSLAKNPCDLPFVICYSVKALERQQKRSGTRKPGPHPIEKPEPQSVVLELQGTVGVPEGHGSAPAEVGLTVERTPDSSEYGSQSDSVSSTGSNMTAKQTFQSDDQMAWPFKEACSTCKPIFIPDLNARHSGFDKRGWDESPRSAVVIPITTDGHLPQALLIVGLNPRRPFNEIYANWLQLVGKQLSTHIAIVKGYAEEVAKTQQLAQLDRAKTMFFSNVNHELRTPLTLILGPLDDILADQEKASLSRDTRDKLTVVSRNAHRLLNLVNSLLDFSRLEAGRMHASFKPVDLASLSLDLASLFRSAIKKGQIAYEVRVPKEKVEVWLDVDLWEKVVFNIIGNAFKYCLSGSIEVRVTRGPHFAEFSVTDTGCGIEESEIDRIFERFHRIESSCRSHEGTGIGLSLTLEIVKLLGGTLDVQSVINEGSTFYVRIPYGSAHLPPNQISSGTEESEGARRTYQNISIVEEASRWPIEKPSPAVSDTGSSVRDSDGNAERCNSSNSDLGSGSNPGSDPATSSGSDGVASDDALSIRNSVILLADDNADMRQYCRSILCKKFQVVDVADGQAALSYARQFSPDLVLSDIMMPRLGGFGLLKALREDPATQLIPMILLSARAGTEARVDGLSAGADDYLAKPFSSKELLARVTTHLQLGKMRRELEKRVHERTRALVESEVRYRNLAEEYSAVTNVSPVGIFSLNSEGNLRFVNPPWYDISGHSRDSPLEEWPNSIHPEDRDTAMAIFNNLDKHPESTTFEFRWLHGEHTQCDIRPQFDSDNNLSSWVGSLTNIEERRRLEVLHLQAVEQRATDAEEMRRQQELFIDITSHEMRNLNSGIYNSADLVAGSLKVLHAAARDHQEGRPVDVVRLISALDQDREAVENIMLCSSAQGRIADDILRYSKLSMGLLSISKSDFHLVNRISEVIAMFSLESAQKQIQLSLAVGPGVVENNVEWINADPHRLSQVLINFLTNALRFTVTSRMKTIIVRADITTVIPEKSPTAMRVGDYDFDLNTGHQLWLTCGVVDSGRGLSPEDRAKLFERFAQANPKTDGVGGYGLGLFVSRKIIELHHGFITVESREGAGSTFSFSVPVSRAQPLVEKASSTISGSSSEQALKPVGEVSLSPFPSQPPAPRVKSDTVLQGGHILIVEDNPINIKVLVRQMKNSGFTTTTAENGQIALDILLAREADTTQPEIDVVLMDVEMPVCDGLTAVGMIREYETTGRLSRKKVIAVTGNARQEQLDVCRAAGFQHGIAIKPYRLPELLALIQAARIIS